MGANFDQTLRIMQNNAEKFKVYKDWLEYYKYIIIKIRDHGLASLSKKENEFVNSLK